jgi:hypothetical protein
MAESISFTLPFGYEKDDKTYRDGKMHRATTGDELEIQDADEAGMNTRYRDILLMTKVIDELDGLKPVTVEIIRDLYEPDFIYLQLLYRQLNGETGSLITTRCPSCGAISEIKLADLYKDMSIYKK